MSEEKRVAAYCRVSTLKEEQQNSLKNQIDFFREYIVSHEGYVLQSVYADEGQSGTSISRRTQFNSMLRSARNGEIDIILTKEVSRFARNTVDTLKYTRELKSLGIGVIFINDNINTLDSDGELRLTIMSSIAQEESRRISERVRFGQKRSMENGVVFGNGLYGYELSDGKLTVNELESSVVKRIFSLYTDEKESLCSVAKQLNEEGIKTRTGKTWSGVTVSKILKNEKYKGDIISKKTVTSDYLTHQRLLNNNIEKKISIKNHHEAIIDANLWERTQQELEKRSRNQKNGRHHSSKDWCSGKIVCSMCKNSYIRKTVREKNGNLYVCWRCSGAISCKPSAQKCNNRTVNDKALRECVSAVLESVDELSLDMSEEMTRDIIKITKKNNEREIRRLKHLIEGEEERQKKALDLLMEGIISKKDFSLLRDTYDNRIYSYTEKRNGLINSDAEKNALPLLALASVMTIAAVTDSFDSIIGQLVDTISVDNEDITINFSFCCDPLVFNVRKTSKGYKAMFSKKTKA